MIVLGDSREAGQLSASDREPCNQSHLGLNASSTTSLGKLSNISNLCFPICEMEIINIPTSGSR